VSPCVLLCLHCCQLPIISQLCLSADWLLNCCWPSPAHWFLILSPMDLVTFLLSQIRDSPNLVGLVPIFISPTNRVAQLYPRHWVPFSSPSMTHRAVVEIFKPTSHRASPLIESSLYNVDLGHIENTISNSSFIGVFTLHCHDTCLMVWKHV
jgi:hypothetical protein